MSYAGHEVMLVSTNSNPKYEEIVEKLVIIKEKQKYHAPMAEVNSTCKISRMIWETGTDNIMMVENVARGCASLLSCFIAHKMCALWYILFRIIKLVNHWAVHLNVAGFWNFHILQVYRKKQTSLLFFCFNTCTLHFYYFVK